jgi:hypothetical protein
MVSDLDGKKILRDFHWEACDPPELGWRDTDG